MATHYQVLEVTPAVLAARTDPSVLLKQAYRRALLRHHPDKQSLSVSVSGRASLSDESVSDRVSVDQITAAYAVLSDPVQRRAYDAQLRRERVDTADDEREDVFWSQTGLEVIDLDDLDCHPSAEDDDRDDEWVWTRGCRCGNEQGFVVTEAELSAAETEGQVWVGCRDCSLWLEVHFAVEDTDADPQAEAA